MLDLTSVTLICADDVDADRAVVVLEKCKSVARFGAVRLLTSLPTPYEHAQQIEPLKSHIHYSIFMLKRAVDHVQTPHCLVVQHDGWIINPASWNPAWLQYDYTGPLFIHAHSINEMSVGSGGFSLRSHRLMKFVQDLVPQWDGSDQSTAHLQSRLGAYEDGVIALNLRQQLVRNGFKFAPPSEAAKFAQGGQNSPNFFHERPFGFHGMWNNINFESGLISPPPFH